MMKKKSKIRLYAGQELLAGLSWKLKESQAHYLLNVMKLDAGDSFLAFDGKNGEFECELAEVSKKSLSAKVLKKTRDFAACPDIWLLFAPVKKDQTDFIIQKAVELGCSVIQPVITMRTIAGKTKTERFVAQSIEACEQCRRVDLPEIREAQPLGRIIETWDKGRILYFMDETGAGTDVVRAFDPKAGSAAVLIGPEGGFSPEELEILRKKDFAAGVSLGGRILRAETAVAAALSCWQALVGDWKRS